MIGEMLGGSETLSYRPRKKKRDPNQQSFGEKLSSLFALKKKSSIVGGSTDSLSRAPTKLKSKSQIQQENMDNYWTDYDYENDAYSQPCKMPPSSDDTKTALGSTAVLDGSLSASPSFNFTGFGTSNLS